MKSVLISIQPYYVFLIIAHLMGWDIPQKKTVEIRKNFPQDLTWDKVAHIYCSKNKKSFSRIPKEYHPFMAKLLGKVIGEFVCDEIERIVPDYNPVLQKFFYGYVTDISPTCLREEELQKYAGIDSLYFWHISDLVIYDKPKELGEFRKVCKFKKTNYICPILCPYYEYEGPDSAVCTNHITKPPQSWCYVEPLGEI